MEQKPQFIINSASKPSFTAKLDIAGLETLLNTQIQLLDYGTSIEQILFTFIATPKDDPIKRTEQQSYIELAKVLEVNLKLPYEQLVASDDLTLKESMASLFLKSIALYADLGIPDFDWQIFYIDVKTLLVKEEWLRPNTALKKQFLLDFGIGGTDWLAMGQKMSNIYKIEKSLNRNIQFSEYGRGIHQLQCAFIILPETSILPDVRVKEYIATKKWVKVISVLEYEEFLEADEYSLLHLLASQILKVILRIAELQIADFDWKRLYRHVRWQLIVDEWLDEPLTLQEKTSITGLSNSLIKQIENNVEIVRLGAIKTYCEKLKRPYEDIVPEFFVHL